MNIISIPAYSYFTGDPKSYRTDITLLTSSAFIDRMIDRFPTIVDSAGGVQVYRYEGNPIQTDAYKQINSFLGDSLLPYISLPFQAEYQSDFLPSDPNNKVTWDLINHMCNIMGIKNNFFQISDSVNVGAILEPERMIGLNNSELHNVRMGIMSPNAVIGKTGIIGRTSYTCSYNTGSTPNLYISGTIYPDGIFDSEGLAPDRPDLYHLDFNITANYRAGSIFSDSGIYRIVVRMSARTGRLTDLTAVFGDFEVKGSGMQTKEDNTDNPYDDDGNSSTGGGDGGGGGGWIDSINPAQIPPLPNINVCDLGLITMYNPSQANVKALSDFLWSSTFDLNTYKKLFGDPMEGIIGLAIVPVAPDLGGSKNVKIGNIDSGITMPFLSSNWKEIDCGWVDIEKFVGCFMDADPYTKISIYLPFIGIRSLSADDINGGSIHVVYHVDVLTGACACFIEHSSRGVLYTYNGSCITNVPLTAINFSGAIQNAVSAVISGIGTVAGMATGAAPITAMGAAGLLNSAANTALNSKPHVQRSGNLGGSAGILSILSPYVIIERPDISMPAQMNRMVGNTSNITFTLGALSGFTMCEYVHIEGCTGTSEEVKEIEALLKEGVYL